MFLVFLAVKESVVLEFLGLKDHKVQLDQWALLVYLENLELVNPAQLATLENLEKLVYQEEMAVLDQWVPKGKRVTQELQE